MSVVQYRRRWPKGTYMRLISADLLGAFVGPGPDKKISARKLAERIGKHRSFIDHLLAGRSTSCKPKTATDIAEVLGVPVSVLFDARVPTADGRSVKQSVKIGAAA